MDTGKFFPRGEANHSPPSGPEVKENATGCPFYHIHEYDTFVTQKASSASKSATTAVLRDTMKEMHEYGCMVACQIRKI